MVRDGVSGAARAVLLAGATALAFFSGGYFDLPRVWAGLGVWALVVVALALEPTAPARRLGAWLALCGLTLLGGWTLASMAWAPIAGSAYHAGQLVFLYAGALLAACLLLRPARVQRWVEPSLAAGAAIVIGYGLAGRLLPGILHYSRSVSAGGRLEQPLTYWNATGELAALGFVLCARIVGDETRYPWPRALAAAASVVLGLGLYLSFSRGALFACVAGLLALLVAAPRRGQLQALGVTVGGTVLAAVAAAPLRGVTALAGPLHTRERDGAVVLAALAVVSLAAAAGGLWLARRPAGGALWLPRRAGWLALAVICAGLALAIVVGAKEPTHRPLSVGASRLVTFQSDRYAYWRVAFKAFAHEPVRGVGAGGWAVWWLRYRPFGEYAHDAHSLPLQTLAELGLVGLAFLAALIAGVTVSARAAYRAASSRAAGPIAALVVYAAHAPLDWDWQMPAVTLLAMVLAGELVAMAEGAGDDGFRLAGRPTAPPRYAAPRA